MTEFKVGDRVRCIRAFEFWPNGTVTPENKREATTVGQIYTVLEVTEPDDEGCGYLHIVNNAGEQGGYNHWDFELVERRKDTPRVGDTVRVVLEGLKVTEVRGNVILMDDPDGNPFGVDLDGTTLVKSIEILEPAKPSVKDLPVGSVVTTPGQIVDNVFVKLSGARWISAASGMHYDEATVDDMDWTLLVPQVAE